MIRIQPSVVRQPIKMKLIIISFFCLVLIVPSLAQNKNDTTQHITFKEVPVDGALNEFVSKMEQSGFKLMEIQDGRALLKGDFAGYRNCIIAVATLDGKDLVSHIIVIFPNSKTWTTLELNYFTLKELLTTKYGEPIKVVEKFNTSIEPLEDYFKMHQVESNNCEYHTTFVLDNGIIHLSIENDGYSSSFVELIYIDKVNSKKVIQKAMDDL